LKDAFTLVYKITAAIVDIANIAADNGPNSGIAGFGLAGTCVGAVGAVGVNVNVVLEVLSWPPYVTSISYVPVIFQRSPPATTWVEYVLPEVGLV